MKFLTKNLQNKLSKILREYTFEEDNHITREKLKSEISTLFGSLEVSFFHITITMLEETFCVIIELDEKGNHQLVGRISVEPTKFEELISALPRN